MNIIEAAKFVEKGKKVRRKSWATDTVVQWAEDMVSIGKSNGINFNLNELLADDWEVVEVPMELAWYILVKENPMLKNDWLSKSIFDRGWEAGVKHIESLQCK